jgi:ATP-binding cassette subfamily C protein
MKFFSYKKVLTFEEKKKFIYIIFFIIISAILEILSIGLIIPFFNFFYKKDLSFIKFDLINNYIPNLKFEDVFFYLIIFFIFIYFIKTIFLSFVSYYQLNFLKNLKNDVNIKLFSIYLSKSYEFYLKKNSANLIQNLNDINYLILFIKAEISFFSEILISFFIITLLFIYNPIATVFAFTFFLLAGLLINFFILRKAKILGKNRQTSDRLKLQNLQQGFGAIKEIKIFGLNKYFINRYDFFQKKSNQQEFEHHFILSLPRLWLEFYLIFGTVIFFTFLSYKNLDIIYYLPLIILFIFCSVRIAPSIVRILNNKQQMAFCYPVMKNFLFEYVVSNKNLVFNKLEKKKEIFFKKKILLNNVFFKYSNSKKNILNKVNLSVKFGNIVGIYGPSGVGKTTFVSIILGLLKPSLGEVKADGKNIYDNLTSWQAIISYVPQNVYLIDGSLKSNIALGVKETEINYEDLNSSIKMAQLEDVVKKSEYGFNTRIGELGQKLSAGQRQRIGIARALYKKSKLLILDEFTSSLDGLTEQKIIQSIFNLKKNCTIILISHNEKIISRCQKIYSIDNKGLLHCKK